MTTTSASFTELPKEKLDAVVDAIKSCLADPSVRAISQRAVQGKVWHLKPELASVLSELRKDEEAIRQKIMAQVSKLVYKFHDNTVEASLARAGLMEDTRVHAGSSLGQKDKAFDLFCLDSKERLYMTLKNYGWLQDFFRLYPLHFYENSFQFVERIPEKKLNVKVKVVGLGIGGSIAVSGLAKQGIDTVIGYEKRNEKGPRSVTSRYQNASWRAYDIAGKLVDEKAYNLLIENRQRINVTYDDGSTGVVTSDRVQIIIGAAIQSALDSARRYGAELHFESDMDSIYDEAGRDVDCDIVALFCGAHTSSVFPGLKDEMDIHSWPELDSTCQMWLRVQESDKTEAFCTRGGEIGAEQWHYTIESARSDIADVERIIFNLDSQYRNNLGKLEKGIDIGRTKEEVTKLYEEQRDRAVKVMAKLEEGGEGKRFDYIFTNAPKTPYNSAKREAVADSVVLDGGYTVEIKMATRSTVSSGELLNKLGTKLVVCGGDACVPPNPLAAYGATLACESAGNLVQLAVAFGHLNTILEDMKDAGEKVNEEWINEVRELKDMFTLYYEARSRAENFFQWVQTLICNLYSLPAFE